MNQSKASISIVQNVRVRASLRRLLVFKQKLNLVLVLAVWPLLVTPVLATTASADSNLTTVDTRDNPLVTGVKAKYDGIFLSAVSLLNDYTASVKWNGFTPGNVEFYVNDALNQTVTTSTEKATATIDAGLSFIGSLTLGANKVKVIAVSADGVKSKPFVQQVTIIPPPTSLDILSLPFELIPGKSPGYKFKVQIPPTNFPASALMPIPWFDKVGLNLSGIVELKYQLLGGQWDVRAGARIGSPKLRWGGWGADIEFTPVASGVASQTRGFDVDQVGVKFRLDGKYPILVVYVFDMVPGGQIIHILDTLLFIGVDANSIQRLNVNGLFRLDADLLWSCHGNGFQQAAITPGGGLEALYAPNLLGSSVQVDVTGRLNFPIRLSPPMSWKVAGEVSLGIRAELWGKVMSDNRWIFLSGDIAKAGNWMRHQSMAMRALAPDGTPVLIDGVLLTAIDNGTRPMDRLYLSNGPERFIAHESASLLADDENRILLEGFRLMSRLLAKGSVMASAQSADNHVRSTGTAQAAGVQGSAPAQSDLTLVQNCFPNSQPSLAALGTELMLLYVSDNGNSNDLQFTDIKWTRWDGTNWSQPLAIRTNTQAEFSPQVRYDGNGDAIAVWERVADLNFTNIDLTAMAAEMEIAWSRWSRKDGTWSEPAALTANHYLDHAPLLCGPMANGNLLLTWTKNEANLLMGTNAPGNDTVLWREWSAAGRTWSAPQTLVDGLAYSLSQSLAGATNYAVYAWTRDMDGVLTNDTDQQIFYMTYSNGAWNQASQFTSNGVANKNARLAVSATGDAYMVWQSGTNLVMDRNFSGTQHLVRADSQTAGFADYALTVGPMGNLVLLWQEMSTNGSDAHYSVYDPVSDTWGKDDLLCQDPPLERSFAPVWDNVGNLTVAYNKAQILYTNKTVTIEGGGTVTITNVPQSGRVDLVVTKRALVKDIALAAGDFSVDGANYMPGDPLTLTATVRNVGNVAMSNLVVGFYDGNPDVGGVLLTNVALPGWLEAAATNVVSASWIVAAPAAPHTLYAVVNRDNLVSEFNESNNVQQVSIGGTDLEVSLVSYRAETNGTVRVIAQVQNIGAPTATNTVLAIRRQGETNAPLAVADVPTLEPGMLAQVALDLPPGTQPEGEVVYRLFADETRTVADVNTNNNTTAFAVNLWVDSDGDGIPDSWMIAHFGHSTGLASDKSRAQDDADGDGASNLAEYLAGTDPNNPNSYLRINSITVSGITGAGIAWGSTSNKLYSIQRAGDVISGFTNIAAHILSTPPENTYFDPSTTNSASLFYRIKVE